MRSLPLFRRLAADRSGAAAAELAIAIPVVMLMIMGLIDLSRAISAKMDLEEAAGRSAELATAYGSVRTDYSLLRTEAVSAAQQAGIGSPAATVDNWLECDGVRQPANTNMCQAGQAYARYVSVNVRGVYIPAFTVAGMIAGSGFPITGAATVRIQ